MDDVTKHDTNGHQASRLPRAASKQAARDRRDEAQQTVAQHARNRRNTSRQASRKPARRKPLAASMPRLALAVTVVIGVAIPALTLSLSTLAGRMAEASQPWLAAAACGIGLAVLAVSLSHLAWAICDITHSPRWAGWLLAVSCDLSIVLAECSLVFAPDAGCSRLAAGLLLAVTACSMLLNVWAFLRAR